MPIRLACPSQVHHINPQGEDSGVVYSEMQGRENTSGDLMALQYVNDVSYPELRSLILLSGNFMLLERNVYLTLLRALTEVKLAD